MNEPFCKRVKTDNLIELPLSDDGHKDLDKEMSLNSILSDELTHPIQLENIFLATITDMKQISDVISEINRYLPIPEFQHLKRVHHKRILLCPENDIIILLQNNRYIDYLKNEWKSMLTNVNDAADNKHHSLEEINQVINNHDNLDVDKLIILVRIYLRYKGVSRNIVENLSDISSHQVAKFMPKLKWQNVITSKYWPCKFHPNNYIENLYSNRIFNEVNKGFHVKMVKICLFLQKHLQVQNVVLIVDPRNQNLIACGWTRLDRNPLMHAIMIAIDNVAKTQAGGAWECDDADNLKNSRISQLIKDNFPDINFGVEKLSFHCDVNNKTGDNLSKYGPYLCTGYDIYLVDEPCLMCAMALIHSRAKRIFYHNKTDYGALGTKLKLHTVKELNHHYEVFCIS